VQGGFGVGESKPSFARLDRRGRLSYAGWTDEGVCPYANWTDQGVCPYASVVSSANFLE